MGDAVGDYFYLFLVAISVAGCGIFVLALHRYRILMHFVLSQSALQFFSE